jgi:hypothetical protein
MASARKMSAELASRDPPSQSGPHGGTLALTEIHDY